MRATQPASLTDRTGLRCPRGPAHRDDYLSEPQNLPRLRATGAPRPARRGRQGAGPVVSARSASQRTLRRRRACRGRRPPGPGSGPRRRRGRAGRRAWRPGRPRRSRRRPHGRPRGRGALRRSCCSTASGRARPAHAGAPGHRSEPGRRPRCADPSRPPPTAPHRGRSPGSAASSPGPPPRARRPRSQHPQWPEHHDTLVDAHRRQHVLPRARRDRDRVDATTHREGASHRIDRVPPAARPTSPASTPAACPPSPGSPGASCSRARALPPAPGAPASGFRRTEPDPHVSAGNGARRPRGSARAPRTPGCGGA